jgi:hypothetical protein
MAAASEFTLATSLPLSYWSRRSFETTGLDQIEKKVADAVEWARAFATNIETTELQSPEKKPSAASARSSNRARSGSNKRLAKEITPEKQDDLPPSSSQQDPSISSLNRFILADIIELSK